MSAEENVAALLEVLDLQETAALPNTQEDVFFEGISQYKPDERVFGGQVLAQCVVAAGRTVAEDRPIHSMHGYFLRAGDAREPITFGVEVLRDGGSFSARRVHAYQKGAPIMSVMTSFQERQEGFEHQDPFPEGVPAPEDCPELRELVGDVDLPHVREWVVKRPFDLRLVEPAIYLHHHGEKVAHQSVWIRTSAAFPADQLLSSAALAYASDFNLLESGLRRQGLSWMTPGLRLASLDHAMWWHRPIAADEWMLYSQISPSAEGGRNLGAGRIFAQDGTLLATVAQQGMMRVKPEGGRGLVR
ncbi:acyl-CoA thioesterase II [Brevibacterium samyangense]|uniref:Acyl-CoA thioesterase II n=1 Tax=Brevibacterium samyangense TaxID=366888 RepID=A0ABN2TA52_9MICO